MKNGFADGERVAVTTPGELAEIEGSAARRIEVDFGVDVESAEIKALIEETEKRCFRELRHEAADAVKETLILLMEAKDSRRAAYQLAYAVGMGALIGGSAAQVAKRFGISREAFEQEADRLLASLHLRKAPNEKRPETSETYSQKNFRKPTTS